MSSEEDFSERLWLAELETIRRDQPLIKGRVETVTIKQLPGIYESDKENKLKKGSGTTPGSSSVKPNGNGAKSGSSSVRPNGNGTKSGSSPVKLVVLSSDDDDEEEEDEEDRKRAERIRRIKPVMDGKAAAVLRSKRTGKAAVPKAVPARTDEESSVPGSSPQETEDISDDDGGDGEENSAEGEGETDEDFENPSSSRSSSENTSDEEEDSDRDLNSEDSEANDGEVEEEDFDYNDEDKPKQLAKMARVRGGAGGKPKRLAKSARVRWSDDEGGRLEEEQLFWKEEETLNPYFESKYPRAMSAMDEDDAVEPRLMRWKRPNGEIVERIVWAKKSQIGVGMQYSPEDPEFPYKLSGAGLPENDGQDEEDEVMDEALNASEEEIVIKAVAAIARTQPKSRKLLKQDKPISAARRAKNPSPPPSPPRRIMTRSRTRAAAGSSSTSQKMSLRGGKGPVSKEIEPLQFYGVNTNDIHVYWQDRTTKAHLGQIPSPAPGHSHRLRLDELRVAQNIKPIATGLGPYLAPPHHTTWEEHLTQTFVPDAKRIVNGLPLMENIDFALASNPLETGNCYWRCIAYLIYGTPEAWARVKAEHRAHFEEVYRNGRTHPRRKAYERLNLNFFGTLGPCLGRWHRLNLYQFLFVHCAWVPTVMLQVTADVYGVYIMMFHVDETASRVIDTKTAGAYNSRHIFVWFSGDHYQPLTPNDYYGWEFQAPRVTMKRTEKYPGLMPVHGKKRDGIRHQWRRAEGGLRAPPPVPVDHMWRAGLMAEIVPEKIDPSKPIG